jgi:hypothetical protein
LRKELEDLTLALRDAFNISTFVETGIFKAYTTRWAADSFPKVVSIEIDEGYYNRAVGLDIKARLIHGDSAVELPKVVKRLKKPAIFWLDAHRCKDKPAVLTEECPLLAELTAIKETGLPHLILIDDARYFVEPVKSPYNAAKWPTLDEVKAALPAGYEMVIWQAAIIAMPVKAMSIVRRFVEPDKLEVTVLTSNDYLHCLPPFAYLFNKFWGGGQPVKVVRYEKRPYNLPGNFTNWAIGNQADYTWSSGLIKYLTQYNGELILLMLEDYFLTEPVGAKAIQSVWDFMSQHPEVAKIDLAGDRAKVPHNQLSELFIQSTNDAPFQASLQAAIWRKGFLLRFLDPKENAWQFEKLGTKRIIEAREKGEFDGLILGCKHPPLVYANAIGGEGKKPGEWDAKKIPQQLMSELSGRGLV